MAFSLCPLVSPSGINTVSFYSYGNILILSLVLKDSFSRSGGLDVSPHCLTPHTVTAEKPADSYRSFLVCDETLFPFDVFKILSLLTFIV